MRKNINKKFYMVSKDILPEAILKTAMTKEILARGEVITVNEAVEKVGLSRSAFYKYRDGIFPFYEVSKEKIITVSFILDHKPGVLSNILDKVAYMKGNVLTINQGIPLQNIANTTLSIDTKEVVSDIEELINKLQRIEGVKKVEIVGQS
ncbi:MAG: ACT domain-containing protein [Clostridia bacterium]|nr:ACT domain-containing protein [Clostridia bacterium]MDD4048325.1 ACT domain-containing protein [Clostridia bacterium]